jgi:hypothetical protein
MTLIFSVCHVLTLPQKMGYDPWTMITNCYLNQEVDLLLHIFITAASESDDPQSFLDKLEVDWMAINKNPEPPEHE